MTDDDERPTIAMPPIERADSTRPTVAMSPLFAEVEGVRPAAITAATIPAPVPAVKLVRASTPIPREPPPLQSKFRDPIQIAGYFVDHEIGRGGMGVVYAATHQVLGKRVAIKVLSIESDDSPKGRVRFLVEARALSTIAHANVVDVFDFGTLDDGRPYFVMDLLVGETLQARLRRGPMPIDQAASVISALAAGLDAAHGKGIIHRDLKPENVFISIVAGRPPEIKLLDFGVMKLALGEQVRHATDEQVHTHTGTIVGTPRYMSPQQVRGHVLDHRTDIYALGVISFEMIAGRAPYDHDNAFDTLNAHVEDPIPSLAKAAPSIAHALAQLIESMIAKSPSDRPSLITVREVLEGFPRAELSPPVKLVSSAMLSHVDGVIRSVGAQGTPPEPTHPPMAWQNHWCMPRGRRDCPAGLLYLRSGILSRSDDRTKHRSRPSSSATSHVPRKGRG